MRQRGVAGFRDGFLRDDIVGQFDCHRRSVARRVGYGRRRLSAAGCGWCVGGRRRRSPLRGPGGWTRWIFESHRIAGCGRRRAGSCGRRHFWRSWHAAVSCGIGGAGGCCGRRCGACRGRPVGALQRSGRTAGQGNRHTGRVRDHRSAWRRRRDATRRTVEGEDRTGRGRCRLIARRMAQHRAVMDAALHIADGIAWRIARGMRERAVARRRRQRLCILRQRLQFVVNDLEPGRQNRSFHGPSGRFVQM